MNPCLRHSKDALPNIRGLSGMKQPDNGLFKKKKLMDVIAAPSFTLPLRTRLAPESWERRQTWNLVGHDTISPLLRDNVFVAFFALPGAGMHRNIRRGLPGNYS